MDHYDMNGQPMSMEAWAALLEDIDARRIGGDDIDNIRISTVWLGLNHNYNGGLAIFETMTFGSQPKPHVHSELEEVKLPSIWDERCWRYATKKNAKAGHEVVCRAIRLGLAPSDIEGDMLLLTSD